MCFLLTTLPGYWPRTDCEWYNRRFVKKDTLLYYSFISLTNGYPSWLPRRCDERRRNLLQQCCCYIKSFPACNKIILYKITATKHNGAKMAAYLLFIIGLDRCTYTRYFSPSSDGNIRLNNSVGIYCTHCREDHQCLRVLKGLAMTPLQ